MSTVLLLILLPQTPTDSLGDPLPSGVMMRLGTQRLKHEAGILAVRYSPDGAWLASSSLDRTICVWEASTGRRISQLIGHADAVSCLVVDGGSLISGSWDRTIRSWDAAKGKETAKVSSPGGRVVALALSPKADRLAVAADDRTLRLLEWPSGKELGKLEGPRGETRALAFSPDGRRLASGGQDSLVHLWEISSLSAVRTFKGHEHAVECVAFFPTGDRVASGGRDRTARVWEVESGREGLRLDVPDEPVTALAVSPDGSRLAIGGTDRRARLFEASSGKALGQTSGHRDSITSLAFSPDGKKLASAGLDRVVQICDGGGENALPLPGHGAEIRALAWSADGRTLATSSEDRTARLWDSATGKERLILRGHRDAVPSLAFSPDGGTLATAGWDGAVRLLEVASGQPEKSMPVVESGLAAVAFSPDGRLVAAGAKDARIRIWNRASGEEVRTLSGHENVVSGCAFLDNRTLVSSSLDSTVRFWSIDTGQESARPHSGAAEPISSIAASSDGRTVAFINTYGKVRILEAVTGKELRSFEAGTKGSQRQGALAFSPDGRLLAFVWEGARAVRVVSGREAGRWNVPKSEFSACAFSPDGKRLAIASGDMTVRIVDTTSLRETSAPAAALDAAWKDLAADAPATAYRSIEAFSTAEGAAFLRDRLKEGTGTRIEKLIRDLDDESFEVRSKASADLLKMGSAAAPALKKAMEESASAEVRSRTDSLLQDIAKNPFSTGGESARELRAIQALEQAGSKEAVAALEELVRLKAGPGQGAEAAAALDRIRRRP